VDDELRRAIALAGGWIERGHPEADRLAPLELVVQQTIARVTRRIEIHHVAGENQAIAAGLAGEGRRRQCRDQQQDCESEQVFHALKVTESAWSVHVKERASRASS
jgi:hypothetical protein